MPTFQSSPLNVSRLFALTRLVPALRGPDAHASNDKQDHWVSSAQQDAIVSRTLAGMLLAAVLAALLVAADQVVETWSEGHLLMGWVTLWTLAFVALAFLMAPLRVLSTVLAQRILGWVKAREAERNAQQMWEFAQGDHRLMSELQVALSRNDD